MGSTSSKFKKYVQHGDEFAAMQIFQSSPELRKHLDPNLSYGENHGHNTALHFAAKHGMKHLLRTFLADLGGNPNKRNGRNETVLHSACQLNQQTQPKSFSAHERRAACVTLLLQWRGALVITSDQFERVDLSAQDADGNTTLHCAARTGLRRCVELLLAHGAPLFIENNDRLTPCDVAMKNNQHDIAQLLESRMVFADSSDIVNEDELDNEGALLGDQEEVYSGLRTQDLQEAKDQLLVETSDMLHIPLFTAEALLRDNEWSREALLEKWMKDPVQCCLLAGVQAPASALQFAGGNLDLSVCSSPEAQDGINGNGVSSQQEIECEICLMSIPTWQRPNITMSCRHQFCSTCWERYLTVKIQDGDAHHILCPAYQCHILVPIDVIEKLVSPEMARRYLQFDIKAFVESNRCIKWCPVAECGRAVRLPEIEQIPRNDGEGGNAGIPATSHAVDCGNAHFFCWECLGEAHAPAGCNQWLEWHRKISEVRPEELRTACTESEDAANCLWLVTNSKPCPNCKSPIQKNEGCNHMKCSKCKYDFCWVCQESWKRHSSATGGYFRCNRFEAVHKADERQGSLISEATVRNSHVQELSRFLHFYTRFKNHENSQRLEQPLLHGVRKKMEILASVLPKPQPGKDLNDTIAAMSFIEDGVRELLKARRVLCGSYVYGYYLEDDGYNKTIFEFMQNELEEVTEKLSEMIARPYLRTPKAVIVQTTALTRRKRHEFVRAVSKGLVPPETPPMLRKVRPRNYSDVSLDISEALTASMRNLEASSGPASWQSNQGELTRSSDWPEYESDPEDGESNRTMAVSVVGECKAPGCNRPRARNPKTGATHAYCSLKCSRETEKNYNVYRALPNSDYNMELVIALEMSRLQMIEDKIKKGHGEVIENVNTPGTSIAQDNNSEDSNYGLDDQLKLAIQLSLQESTAAISKQLPGAGASIAVNNMPSTVDQSPLADTTPIISMYNKTTADITVDYFLKSLANQKIDFRNFTSRANNENSIQDAIGVLDDTAFFKVANATEDGLFQITDFHTKKKIYEYISFVDEEDEYDESDSRLRRSYSTGDLCVRRSGRGFNRSLRTGQEEPRYYLDLDYSSRHNEKPEDISLKRTNRIPHHMETSDSLNADLEVCGILQTGKNTAPIYNNDHQESSVQFSPIITSQEPIQDHKHKYCYTNPFASLKAKLCSAQISKGGYLSKMAVNKSIGLLSENKKGTNNNNNNNSVSNNDNRRNSDHAIPKKKSRSTNYCSFSSHTHTKPLNSSHKRDGSFSKSTSFLLDKNKFKSNMGTNLRIKICNSPLFSNTASSTRHKRELETDSSNEYESETGIPKSPTLFISGVSICRTPEPKSPAISLLSNSQNGRTSRSSSLTVCPATTNSGNNSQTITITSTTSNSESPSFIRSTTPINTQTSPHKELQSKAKSASEPEREREMFRFPKSSTDGALSSVLHVQESNLSSDDFHEALFLLERSPKIRDSKRKKKSKKKEKEYSNDRMKEDASSAL